MITLFLFIVILQNEKSQTYGNIHRAVPGSIPSIVLKGQKTSGNILIDEEEADEEVNNAVTFFQKISSMENSWIWAIISSLIVGSTGIFPLFIFRVEDGHSLKEASMCYFFVIVLFCIMIKFCY